MTTLLHQLKVVSLLQISLKKRLDNRLLRIINQNHDMRQLNSGIFPNPNPWRQAVDNRTFGSPDHGFGARAIIVGFQIERHNQALARWCLTGFTINQNKPLLLLNQNTISQVLIHTSVDVSNSRIAIIIFQINLREDQTQG